MVAQVPDFDYYFLVNKIEKYWILLHFTTVLGFQIRVPDGGSTAYCMHGGVWNALSRPFQVILRHLLALSCGKLV